MVGFVNLGSGPVENDAVEAREVIVILAVGLQGHWKVPLGYFLVDGISAEIQSQLLLTAISSLHQICIRVTSIVMDGHPTNQRMANILGGNLNPDNIRSTFQHPSNPELNVYIFFDACHLLKNFRGALHSLQQLQEEIIGTAKWSDIKRLEELQRNEGLRAANKLTKKHIEFTNRKMNVKLAVQVLSNSVAKSLQFASSVCEDFGSCQGTINLVAMVDRMFDIFNSRTPAAKGFKHPINARNFESFESFLLSTSSVLLNLKDMAGQKVCHGKRKICIIGFLCNIQSLLGLAREMILSNPPALKYLLTYKLSQDHLELLFSAIRRYGGWNNNPSAVQFSNAYRSLLGHVGVSGTIDGNTSCVPQDITSILEVDNTEIITFEDALADHDYPINGRGISSFVEGVLEYIAGWVVRKLMSKVQCVHCAHALVKPKTDHKYGLLNIKNNGGLCIPSNDVIQIVRQCEVILRSFVHIKHVKPNEWENVVVSKVMMN
ncbi:hypothetical protein SNE40_021247 [Patella caerulea]